MKKKFLFLILISTLSISFLILYIGLQKKNSYVPEKILNNNQILFSAKDLFSNEKIEFNNLIKNNKITVLNIWSSWCVPCRNEHAHLMNLSIENNIDLIGLNYKDRKKNAKKFITELGNPFKRILIDKDGIISINIGAYGVPETYIINSEKKIIKKYIGPLTLKNLKEIKKLSYEIN